MRGPLGGTALVTERMHQKPQLVEVSQDPTPLPPEIRDRLGRKAPTTRQYLVRAQGETLGYVALDLGLDQLVLYELWILRGMGAAALVEVEELASQLGYSEILIRPSPLDDEIDAGRLTRFYTSRGYSKWRHDSQVLAKPLRQRPQSA